MFKEGKKKAMDTDEFKFIGAKFKSKYFAETMGFAKPAFYKIASIDSSNATAKIYSWTAESVSDIKEKMMWSGTINGENIEGTSYIIDEKGEPTKYKYVFNGTLKKKAGQK